MKISKAFKVVTLILIFAGFLLLNIKKVDPDLGWHLRVGQMIFSQGIPHYDQFSHTMPGFEWVDHEWLIDAWLWWMYIHNLWWLIIFFFTLLAFFPFITWVVNSRTLFHLVLVLAIAIAITGLIGVRSQIISFFFFFLVFTILHRHFILRNISRKIFYCLPLIFLIWANLHAGFFSGLILLTIFVVSGPMLEYWKQKKIENKSVSEWLVLFLSFAVTFITPYYSKLYREIFTVLFSQETARNIVEWFPPLASSNYVFISTFIFIFAMFAFFLLQFRKQYPIQIFMAGLLFGLMYLKSLRIGPLFFCIAVPFCFLGIDFAEQRIDSVKKQRRLSPLVQKILAIMTLFTAFLVFELFIEGTSHFQPQVYPIKAIAATQEETKKIDNPLLFNVYGWGGSIIFHAPDMKVFIDGRMPHWVDKNGDSAMKDYLKVTRLGEDGKSGWQEIFKKRKINLVLIKNPQKPNPPPRKITRYIASVARNIPIVKKVISDEVENNIDLESELVKNNWQITYRDDLAVVLKCTEKCYGD